ncbi:vanadium-dependent haloperoxidase [Gloeobacter kilaueensis]|uniref:Phosphoesterase n=1 Tax=Gloeobacter kilaueensis (strain ATCC BAA-2537 / CCAP 1431/1 / ULC 316 / JS1) TaxID=1183438 RepID=U5QL94_GLOK1|nr:vanadium-dependent haloperoxidase [Gloeobacter kilaueensis]AGY59762.1 hypothetical protein GKIL_3516 [Gloeobacter kilaueensis JS1]
MSEISNPSEVKSQALPADTTEKGEVLSDRRGHSRRLFLAGASTAGIGAAFLGTLGATPAKAKDIGPLRPSQRKLRSYQIRVNAAKAELDVPVPKHPTNGDETKYPNFIGNFSKGLPHDNLGQVDPNAYNSLINALTTGNPADFESIQIGLGRPLVNPQAALAFDLQGTDSHQLAILPAPGVATAETVGEMVEMYWHAALRDVPASEFEDGTTNALVLAAVEDLNKLSIFRGPRNNGLITPGTLFRGNAAYINSDVDPTGKTGRYVTPPGVLTGPYFSQFFWLNSPFGANFVSQQMLTAVAGVDYMSTFDEWLLVQNGGSSGKSQQYDPVRRYITNGRDIGQWVHVDVLFQAYFVACLTLLGGTNNPDAFANGIGAPPNPGNPYNGSKTQIGFGTFGPPYFINLVSEVATRALKAVWFQKWAVHRRLRPEAYGGLVYNNYVNGSSYPISDELFNSAGFANFKNTTGGLLPMAFPEGSPTHPAYGAGHATVAAACVTILKAVFDENYVIAKPVLPNPSDPTQLIPYEGPALTIGGELNKLAANVAIGRNFAGVHWRSDAASSLPLGEALAISILRDQKGTYNEAFNGFTFTKFDGSTITI